MRVGRLLSIVALASALSTAAGAEVPKATMFELSDVTIVNAGAATQVRIAITGAPKNGPLRYRAALIEEPPRLVVDLEDTTYAWRQRNLDVSAEPVTQVGGSQHTNTVARVVIALTRRTDYRMAEDSRGLSITFPRPGADGRGGATPLPDVGARRGGSPLDLEAVKRKLAQLAPLPAPPPPPPLAPPGEAVGLTLQRAVDLALETNLGVQSAALAKDSAQQGIRRVRAALFHPTAGFALTAREARPEIEGVPRTSLSQQTVVPFVRQTFPTATSVEVSGDLARAETSNSISAELFDSTLALRIVQPLLRGGRPFVVTRPLRDAEFDFRIASEQLKSAVLQVTARTKRAYYDTLLAEKIIEVTDAAIERDKILVDASQALFRARIVTKRDVFSAELVLAQDTTRLVSAKADRETARNALLEVLGLPIGTEVELLEKGVDFEPIDVEQERWIATALRNRPEVTAFEQLVAKSSLAVLVARNAVLPQLDLVASYGRTEIASSFGRSLGLGGDVWSAGLVFSIPIGNVAANAALAQAELSHARLLADFEQTRRQIELQVRAIAIRLRTTVERMKSLTVAIEQAKGKLEVGRAQFSLGQVTNLDITDAQQSLLNAETDLLTAILGYKSGLADLEAALADGTGLRFWGPQP